MTNGTGQDPNARWPIVVSALVGGVIGGAIGGYVGAQAGSNGDEEPVAQVQPQNSMPGDP